MKGHMSSILQRKRANRPVRQKCTKKTSRLGMNSSGVEDCVVSLGIFVGDRWWERLVVFCEYPMMEFMPSSLVAEYGG